LNTAYFSGNAPSIGQNVFDGGASDFTVTHPAGSTGFTDDTWHGYPTEVGEKPTTTVPPTTTTTAPTAIGLSSLTATPANRAIVIKWTTETEINNAGFNLYRSDAENGQYTKINTSLIAAQGPTTQGAHYEFTDTDVQNRNTYYYMLEDIDLSGKSTMHGSVSAKPRWVFGIFGK